MLFTPPEKLLKILFHQRKPFSSWKVLLHSLQKTCKKLLDRNFKKKIVKNFKISHRATRNFIMNANKNPSSFIKIQITYSIHNRAYVARGTLPLNTEWWILFTLQIWNAEANNIVKARPSKISADEKQAKLSVI